MSQNFAYYQQDQVHNQQKKMIPMVVPTGYGQGYQPQVVDQKYLELMAQNKKGIQTHQGANVVKPQAQQQITNVNGQNVGHGQHGVNNIQQGQQPFENQAPYMRKSYEERNGKYQVGQQHQTPGTKLGAPLMIRADGKPQYPMPTMEKNVYVPAGINYMYKR
jgi:hypothetical protein